ncbi:MAG: ATP phosphoribosyltransferase regulatory subunit, partial [Verrucomicrobia bacterium]|nr:ATP phosphoribosyltransferase regulatory subunit [Verrucomicrobiota bacterium]
MAFPFQALPGFRDFAPRERSLCTYLFEAWSRVAGRYGFSEYEAPILESAELYLKKSGGELGQQLFRFEDQGGRDIVLRPELTASLARIVGEQQRDYPKPLKWFEIGRCFRYEKPQKGRLREFYQFNADILGEASPAADAELAALAIDVMLELGFRPGEFVVRLSDRAVWREFCQNNNIAPDQLDAFLQVVDKLERDKPEVADQKFAEFGLTRQTVCDYAANPGNASPAIRAVLLDLKQRGLDHLVEVDLSIVR